MPKRIPILAASDIAKAHDCRQVIVVAWDGKLTHVVTYGVSQAECDQAAQGGNLVKRALGWPESLCNDEPSRVAKLIRQRDGFKQRFIDAQHDVERLCVELAAIRDWLQERVDSYTFDPMTHKEAIQLLCPTNEDSTP